MTAALELPRLDAQQPVDLASPSFHEHKYDCYRWMRDEAPVCVGKVSLLKMFLVSRHADCMALLRDPRFVRNRTTATGGGRFPIPLPPTIKALTRGMINEDDPEHRRLRGLVNKAFTPRAVSRFEGRVEELSHQLLDRAEKQGEVDLVRAYALPIPVTIIGELVGVGPRDMPRFSEGVRVLSEGMTGWSILRSVLFDLPKTIRFVRELIEAKRQDPQDDLLTGLIQAEENGERLSEDELVSLVFLLIVAGYETTGHLITNATLTLLQHPDALEALRSDPALTESAVEELLRFRGPVHGTKLHYATEDVEWHGVTIPKGKAVIPMLGAANHDPEVFDEPEQLHLDRDPNRHLGFSFGNHFCLGAQLARMETRIALRTLIDRNPSLQLAVAPESLELQNLPGWHRYKALPVKLG